MLDVPVPMVPDHMIMAIDFVESDTFKPFVIPVVGLAIGGGLMAIPQTSGTAGRLALYFGAQSFMNIFMGWFFRTHVPISRGVTLPSGQILLDDLHGCPLGFALTAVQQVVSFLCFLAVYGCLYFTPYKIQPKKITSKYEVLCICVFGCVFALNIALNNFSRSYISISLNLVIRSCLSLTTFLTEQGLAKLGLYNAKPHKPLEVILLVAGVVCAAAFTVARILSVSDRGQPDSGMILGVSVCVASLLCGSLNIALAGVLGEMKLSIYDTVAYTSIPAALFLLPLVLFFKKPLPGGWDQVFETPLASDLEILLKVIMVAPRTFALLLLSGIFAFAYNIVQLSIVQTLSPSSTAFGGNFNKAALVLLTMILPALQVHSLPGQPWIWIIWAAVLGNIFSFAGYSFLQIQVKDPQQTEGIAARPEAQALTCSNERIEGKDGV